MRMSRRRLIATALAFLAATPLALAAPPPKADEHGAAKEGEGTAEKEIARSIDLSGLVFPVFDEKGKLQNYLFVSARMMAGPGKDVWKYREKLHFIRDSIVRAAHRTSFNAQGDYNKLDEKRAAELCIKAANEAVGERDALVTMTFTQIASQAGKQQQPAAH
jgi:hypothetical protein